MGSLPRQEEVVYDVLIVGAGLSGICTLHHVRSRFPGWRIKLIEAADGPGGVWHWNRYPGARFDSESISYCYSFDQQILDTWHWKEAFSSQPETLKYINHVCDKLDLRKDMQFNTRIASAEWKDADRTWVLRDEKGVFHKSRFFVSCLGFLSEPTRPAIPGIESFRGASFHTSRWPQDCVPSRDFAGKRIGVIGTGATGIQTITTLSKMPEIKSLHVFQRTASWSAPLRNTDVTSEQMEQYRRGYEASFKRCAETPMGFLHRADPRKSSEVTPEERLALWEQIYAQPGMSKWLGTFSDTYTDREANRLYSEFMAQKIRERVLDPVVAESLIPKNHGFGTKRVPLESGYFEAYNQDNVHLVDLRKSPIQHFTECGIEMKDGSFYPLDVVIYATGFDAITGAFNAIDFRGKGNAPLIGRSGTKEGANALWLDHRPRTHLGIAVPGMPNFFMVMGPHQPFGNATPNIEHSAENVCKMLEYCKVNKITYAEATQEAADKWTKHVFETAKGALSNEIDSWMTGVNTNVEGKSERTVARYAGSAIKYRRLCKECREQGWTGFAFQ